MTTVSEFCDAVTFIQEKSIDGRRLLIVVLTFTAIMLNYMDRQIIALLKPTLQVEFGWSNAITATWRRRFQLSAALAFLGTGWFIDRVGLRGVSPSAWAYGAWRGWRMLLWAH